MLQLPPRRSLQAWASSRGAEYELCLFSRNPGRTSDEIDPSKMFYIRTGSLSYTLNHEAFSVKSQVAPRRTMRQSVRNFVKKRMTRNPRTSHWLGTQAEPKSKQNAETGQCICEMSIWTLWKHRGDAAADKCCEVFLFDGSEFAAILRNSRWLREGEKVLEYARRYIAWMNTVEDSEMHDLAAPDGMCLDACW